MSTVARTVDAELRAGPPPSLWRLSWVVTVLAGAAAAAGLLWPGDDGSTTVSTIRGEAVELYGSGLYRWDTVFIAAGSKGTDAVTLLVAVPLLVAALVRSRRGSLRAGLVLAGGLTYMLYVHASRALSNAYNEVFLLYVAAFSASLFALVLAISTVDRHELEQRLSAGGPPRGLVGFLVACGLVTATVWLLPLVGAIVAGEPPELLDTYTTSVTDVLDLGVIVPTLLVAAWLVRRRSGLGYLLAAATIVLLLLVAATIVAGTVWQLAAGVSFTPGQVIGPISGFLVLGVVGAVLLARLLRDVARGRP